MSETERTRPEAESMATEAMALSRQIRRLLLGRQPDIISAALAEALSIVIAGHMVTGDKAETDKLRADLLDHFMTTAKLLVEANDPIKWTSPSPSAH